MNELAQLTKRRLSLLNSIAIASDKIKRIDERLNFLSHCLDGSDPDEVRAEDLIDGNLIELEKIP